MGDLNAGTTVYYDRRWAVTDRCCRFFLAEPTWVADRTVVVLGAGVGLETLVLGRLCRKLYINDLSPTALRLCTLQLRRNGIRNVICLPGRYEHLFLPLVDLIVGCFLVYNRETGASMRQLLARCTPPVLLMNDNLPCFRTLLRKTSRQIRSLLPHDHKPCYLFI
jgi:predicted nicotinamide N-methyase